MLVLRTVSDFTANEQIAKKRTGFLKGRSGWEALWGGGGDPSVLCAHGHVNIT